MTVDDPLLDPLMLYWLAGLLEGEGSFMFDMHGPLVAVQMTDRDIIERVATLWGVKVLVHPPTQAHYKIVYLARVKGARAVDWMRWLYPLLGTRRKAQIDGVLNRYEPKARRRLHPHQHREMVSLVLDHGLPVREVAARFGIQRESLYRFLRRYREKLER